MMVKTKIKKSWFKKQEKLPLKFYFNKHIVDRGVGIESSNDEIVRDVLKVDPLLLIETTFPLIEVYEKIIECDDNKEIGDVTYRSDSFGVFFNGEFKYFSRLTGVNIEEYGVNVPKELDYELASLQNEFNDSKLNLSLHDYNRFTGQFSLIGSFQGVSDDFDILVENGMYVKANFWGVPSNIDSPAWIEYLIDAAINYANNDYKMAALNYFSAYENFVSIIHDQFIFERYARKALKTTIEFNEVRSFSQNRKRLSAKSTDVAINLNMFDDDLKQVIKKLDLYAEKRNKIAHGATTNIGFDVADMAYYILIYMYTIGYGINILQNDWKYIINKNGI